MIVLVVGGAKSGKSMFAQNLSKSLNESLKNPISGQLDGEIEREVGKLYYVATMNPYDLEDLKRIENHLREREGYGFNTIEETLNSITSLVTNYMFRGKEFYKDVSDDILSGILEIINNSKNVVIVSDYLFSDSIQYDCYTENFRKEIGVVNRKLAKIADTVVECSYGNIIYHKGKVI